MNIEQRNEEAQVKNIELQNQVLEKEIKDSKYKGIASKIVLSAVLLGASIFTYNTITSMAESAKPSFTLKQKAAKKVCEGVCVVDINKLQENKGYTKVKKDKVIFGGKQLAEDADIWVISYEGAYSTAKSEKFRDKLENVFASAKRGDVVLFDINSFGGEATACSVDHDMIVEAADAFGLHTVATVDNYALSCGYKMAAAANHVYVNKASMVGNIGSAMVFGDSPLTALSKSLGGKTYAFGSTEVKKVFAGGFDGENPEHVKIVQMYVDASGNAFKQAVMDVRGDKITKPAIAFSSYPFKGTDAITLGLADEARSKRSIYRELHTKGYKIKQVVINRVESMGPFTKKMVETSQPMLMH